MKNSVKWCAMLVVALTFASCSDDGSFNMYTVEQDIEFGKQYVAEFESSGQVTLLNETEYSTAYSMLNNYKNAILNSGEVKHKDDFEWRLKIIRDDNTVNAFCVPGGYIYVYTGLIKNLQDESELVGVLGHEMAHADKRHSTEQMTKAYGLSMLTEILLGGSSSKWRTLTDITTGLFSLKFSRNDETEADTYAVKYEYQTKWDARGVGSFFARAGSSDGWAILSTHPTNESRVDNVNKQWNSLGGKEGEYGESDFQTLKNSIR